MLHLRRSYSNSHCDHLPPSPVGQGRVEAEELLVLRGVVPRVVDERRAATVVGRGLPSPPLPALRGQAGPATAGLAGVATDAHQGEALVAGVERGVLEMSSSQTDLPVSRVRQLRALPLRSDAGETTEPVTQTELLLVVAVPVLRAFLHTAHPGRRHGELVPGRAGLLSLHVSQAVLELGQADQQGPAQLHLDSPV